MIIGTVGQRAQSQVRVVDIRAIVDSSEKLTGKLVRVRGFLVVELHRRDLGGVFLYSGKRQAEEDPEGPAILISLKNSRVGTRDLKSGWVEITARVTSVPVAGGGHIPALTAIQRIDELKEPADGPP